MPNRTRVAIIGLDAGTYDVINPLFDRGKLQTLHHLFNEGVHAELISTTPPITPPAWTSLVTGMNPGKHGIFDFVTRKAGTYEEKLVNSSDRKCEAIWNIASRFGKNVIVVNVPMTYPPERVSGCMISGIGAPPYSEDIAWPKAILNEIEVTCGKYRVMYDKAPSDSCDEFMADLTKLIRLRGAAVRYLMGKVDWDFLMVVFQSTDWVQHFFWRFFDKTHPLFVPDSSPCERNAIADTYQAIDDEVRKILDELRKDDYMFVVSDHGMGPLYKNIYLNNWLAKNGFLHYKWTPRYITHRMGITSGRLNKLLIKFRIASLRKPKFLGKREAFSYLTLSLSDIDWSRTRAYSIGLDGNVRLNVDGREPNGIVSFGNEYSRLIADLKTRIQNIRDPTTEERIADDVFSRDEIFVGPYLDQGPDLVPVLTRYHQDLNWGSNAIIGPSQADISGNHRPAGIMIVSGPSICKGRSLGPRSLINIAPTVLHLLGIHALEKLDGEMMTDIFDDSHKMEPEQTESADHSSLHINTPVVYTREEEEQLKQRLRKLGYL